MEIDSIHGSIPARRLMLLRMFLENGQPDALARAIEADRWVWEETEDIGQPTARPSAAPGTDKNPSNEALGEGAVDLRKGPEPTVQKLLVDQCQENQKPHTKADFRAALPLLTDKQIDAGCSNAYKTGRLARRRRSDGGPGYEYFLPGSEHETRAPSPTASAKTEHSRPLPAAASEPASPPPSEKPTPLDAEKPSPPRIRQDDEQAQIERFLAEKGPTTEVDWGPDAPAVKYLREKCAVEVFRSPRPAGGKYLINGVQSSALDLWQRATKEAELRGVTLPKRGQQ